MKRKIGIMFLILLCSIILYGCGKEDQEKQEAVKAGVHEKVEEDKLEYDLVSEEVVKIAKDDGMDVHYLAEIKNTSTKPLYFDNTGNSIDLENAKGEILAVAEYIYVRPSVINPGESGYISETILFASEEGNGLSSTDIGKAILHLDANKTDEVPIPNVEITEATFGIDDHISITGRIENKEQESLEIVHIIIPIRDSNNKLCAVALGQVENIKPEKQKGFEASDFIYYDGDLGQLKMQDATICGDRKMFGVF